jgi:hypothetical protein
MVSLSIFHSIKLDCNNCLFFVCLFISDFAMSNEIKDNEDIHSNKEINDVKDQQSPSENGHAEEPSTDDKKETETSLSTSIDHEIPLETPFTDVIIEEEEDRTSEDNSLALPQSEENSSALPISEENSSALPVSEEDNTPVDIAQSESINQSDNTNKLLRTIADKSNKEASSAILNTVS